MEGVILAGGRSTRMGHDKQLLEYGGQWHMPLLMDMVQALVGQCLVVSNLPELYEPFESDRVRVVSDDQRFCGPVEGLYQALKVAQAPWLLVIPCDVLPGVRTYLEAFIHVVETQGLIEGDFEWIGCLDETGKDSIFPFLIHIDAMDVLEKAWGDEGHHHRGLFEVKRNLRSCSVDVRSLTETCWQSFNDEASLIAAGGGLWTNRD